MAGFDPAVCFIGPLRRVHGGIDLFSAARHYEIRRMPESFEPSGNQPFLDNQESGELLRPAEKPGRVSQCRDAVVNVRHCAPSFCVPCS